MAEVDFTNARITPLTLSGSVNPTYIENVSLANDRLYDSSNVVIASGLCTRVVNTQKQEVFLYSGTFSASGTEFYVRPISFPISFLCGWKVSNISFSSGDTYTFKIRADLICQ